MPKIIDPELRARAVRLVAEHQHEYPSFTAAAAAVAKQFAVGKETVRRWLIQDQVDAGTRARVTRQESEEIKRLKSENRRLREDVAILKGATSFSVGGHSTPTPLIAGFIDAIYAEGHAVESNCSTSRWAAGRTT